MVTWKPAASSTSTAAWAVPGWKWLFQVSGQSRTVGPSTLRGARAPNQWRNVSGANRGMLRCGAMVATAFTTRRSPGAWAMKLARRGARAASPAHQYMRPKV